MSYELLSWIDTLNGQSRWLTKAFRKTDNPFPFFPVSPIPKGNLDEVEGWWWCLRCLQEYSVWKWHKKFPFSFRYWWIPKAVSIHFKVNVLNFTWTVVEMAGITAQMIAFHATIRHTMINSSLRGNISQLFASKNFSEK